MNYCRSESTALNLQTASRLTDINFLTWWVSLFALNVQDLANTKSQPYDCGMFFTRSVSTLQSIFTNPNAAYLASGTQSSIPSPLNIGLENSRRFRALPAYAALLNEGRPGYASLLANMVQLSRKVAVLLRDSKHYELLPDDGGSLDEVFMIVLFRAKDGVVNRELVERINRTRQMYVSGTSWKGEKAVRMAVSNWMVDVERDFKVVTTILNDVAEGREFDIKSCLGL